ncbi:MAG: DALR domain-containing protein, partial [Ignavibacteriales bacterium]
AEAIRLLFAQAHYRGPIDFTDELLAASEKGLEKLTNLRDAIESALSKDKSGGVDPDFNLQSFEKRFNEALDDDLNTSQAVAVIFDFVKEVNRKISEFENLNIDFYIKIKEFLIRTAGNVLGIINFDAEDVKSDSLLENNLIGLLIEIRQKAKKEKNFQLADEIRKKLEEYGVILKDTKDGTDYLKRN